ADSVLILPNHPNVIPAGERAAEQSEQPARVVPARSVPAGLAAAAAFNPMISEEDNDPDMLEAAGGCVDIELAKAARDADTAAGVVRAGDWLGLVEGEVIMVGDDPGRLAAKLVSERRADEHEILTLIVGADASDPEAAGLETAL